MTIPTSTPSLARYFGSTPNYLLTAPGIGLVLTGTQEGCMDNFPLSFNHNHFAGRLGPFSVRIHADGGWMGGAPPAGAGAFWCCHG